MADDDYCYLTTTGRVSGQPHEIEIWYERDGDTVFLLAGAGHASDWVRNLVADDAVTVRFGSDPEVRRFRARVLDDDTDESANARRLVFDKYQGRGGGDLSGWRVAALPVALDPV